MNRRLPVLRDLIDRYFSAEELKSLCFSLGLDYGDLGGETKRARIESLLDNLSRRNRVPELIAILEDERPNVPWELGPQAGQKNPYRGLAAFSEEDAAFFFGRDEFIQRLAEEVRSKNLVAVVGSSGSGKSSVVFAGLMPELRQEEGWIIGSFRPGQDPFRSLAAALVPILEPDLSEIDRLVEVGKLAGAFDEGQLNLVTVSERILEKNASADNLLLVSDQFEELYTLCPDAKTRQDFLNLLLTPLQEGNDQGPVKLVMTMRADFMNQALGNAALSDVLQNHTLFLGPMRSEELIDVVEQPALRSGATFDSGLAERLLGDIGAGDEGASEPGDLPLLEFALTLLWERQEDGRLTHTAYEDIGRVKGALARHADAVYSALSPGEQTLSRRVFTQMVQPGLGTEDTRRQASSRELGDSGWQLARYLAGPEARLVVAGIDESNHETAEIIHEALIQHWGLLQEWLDEDRAFRIWQERLRVLMDQWQGSGQDVDALLRGLPLSEAERWLAERSGDLAAEERGFVEASVMERTRREDAERLRQEEELATQSRTVRQQRIALGVMATLLIGIIIVAFLAFQAGAEARAARATEEVHRIEAQDALATSEASQQQAAQAAAEVESISAQRIREREYQKYLADTGWGVIFAADADPDLKEALQPLLDHRQIQASEVNADHYREFEKGDGYRDGESASAFLARHGVEVGPVDPGTMPYYLLIVGGPETIPWEFQYQLDIQYAVGRIAFDTVQEYAQYAANVVDAETSDEGRPPKMTVFAPNNDDDHVTSLAMQELAVPLAVSVAELQPGWEVDAILAGSADKEALKRQFEDGASSALLFTTGHGMTFPRDSEERIFATQGALVTQDWPGPKSGGGISSDMYFAASDIPENASFPGSIIFMMSSHSAGTPRNDNFASLAFAREPREYAPYPFLSQLSQRMLSHQPGGALAVIGHVDSIWGFSFFEPSDSDMKSFGDEAYARVLIRLVEGFPVGATTEVFDQRYAELIVAFNEKPFQERIGEAQDPYDSFRFDTAAIDARNYVILGDPATHLRVTKDDESGTQSLFENLTIHAGESSRHKRSVAEALLRQAEEYAGVGAVETATLLTDMANELDPTASLEETGQEGSQ